MKRRWYHHAMSGYGEFLCVTLGSSLLATAANASWLRYNAEGGRAYDTGYYLLHPLFLRLGLDPVVFSPAWMAEFWRLERWVDFCAFTLVAALAVVPLNVIAGGILWFVLTFAGRVIRPIQRSVPMIRQMGLAALLLAPAILVPAQDGIYRRLGAETGHGAMIRWSTLYAIGVTGGFLILIWLALVFLERRRGSRFAAPAITWAALTVGVLIMAVWLVGAGLAPERPAPATGPNILLVSIDSVRAGHLSCYGYQRKTTPNLDELARQGVLFETTVAPSSWTLPSHMSLLTGLDPLHHGLEADFSRLRPGVLTLAEVFWSAGYETAGFVASIYVEARWGFARGFAHFDDYSGERYRLGNDVNHNVSKIVVDRLRRWLDGWDGEKRRRPFFVFLHLMNVHYDYDAPEPYKKMFDPDYQGEITGKRFINDNRINRNMPRRVLDHLIARYDGEIRFADACLGELFDHLRTMQAFDNTVVAVTSDHGDEFFEHGWKGHRETLYDEVLLVPLILRYPRGLPQGLRVKEQVRLIDVAPTLLRLAGVRETGGFGALARPPCAARDLTPLTVAGEAGQPSRLAVSHLSEVFTANSADLYSVRTDELKLITTKDSSGRDRVEFYELTSDPREQHDLGGTPDPRATELREIVEGWKRQRGAPAGRARQLGPRELEILKSLGYLK